MNSGLNDDPSAAHEARPPSRPALVIEEAEKLFAAPETRTEALRLFASLSTSRPEISTAAILKLAEAGEAGMEERVIAARLALAEGRFAQAAGMAPAANSSGDADLELRILRAGAALLAGDLRAAQMLLELPETPALGNVVGRRYDWLLAYVDGLLGKPSTATKTAVRAVASRWAGAREPRNAAVAFGLFDYKSPDLARTSSNIGDYMQTLAALRHLARFPGLAWEGLSPDLSALIARMGATWRPDQQTPRMTTASLAILDRDAIGASASIYGDGPIWTILNGWFSHKVMGATSLLPLPANVEPIIVSFHIARASDLTEPLLAWLREKAPVGCRDWSTLQWLVNAGVEAFFSGCLTQTLSAAIPQDASRAGQLYVDADVPEGALAPDGARIEHETTGTRATPFESALLEAADLLDRYGRAEHVTTSRLHCLLPCRALGTPTTFVPTRWTDRRFSGLVDPVETVVGPDPATLAERLHTVLDAILEGGGRGEIREMWRALNARDVAAARQAVEDTTGISLRRPAKRDDPRAAGMVAPRPDKVVVAIAFDDRIATHVPTMLRSLRAHTAAEIELIALTRGLSPAQVEEAVAPAKASRLRRFDMGDRLGGLEVELSDKTTISTMDRLFLPELAADIDKLVYLDIDIAVLGDVAELAAYDTSRCGVAARPVQRAMVANLAEAVERRARLVDRTTAAELRRWAAAGTELLSPYFNAGVLVLSLEKMRRARMTQRALDLVAKFGLHDQDALNLLCGGDFVPLPPEWNARPYFDWIETPKIVHWVGAQKPWAKSRAVRWASHWRQYDQASEAPVGSVEHWRNALSYSRSWDERARLAAQWLDQPVRVLDLGCGPRMALRELLPEGSEYKGADLKAWDEGVDVVDLNALEIPQGSFDVVAMLGVAEYLARPGVIFSKLRRAAERLIVSYCHPKPYFNREERRRQGWINAYTEARFVELLESMGWRIEQRTTFGENDDQVQILYDARAAERRAPRKPAAVAISPLAQAVRAERLTYLRPEKLARLEKAAQEAAANTSAGDFAEFGMALGGSGIVIARHARSAGRKFFGFDVFAMIPPPTSSHDGPDARERYQTIAKGESRGLGGEVYYGYQTDLRARVAEAFLRHGLPADGNEISLVEGLFEDTLPRSGLESVAFAHIDCDWYDPVAFCLRETAKRLSPGGVIVVDDYHDWSGCRAAVDQFLEERGDFRLEDGANAILRRVPRPHSST